MPCGYRGMVTNPPCFNTRASSELESLKRANPGNSLWCALIDNVIQAVLAGHAGRDALLAGARAALFDRAARGICQVEEHYLRRTTEARTESCVRGCTRVLRARRLRILHGAWSALSPPMQRAVRRSERALTTV